MAKEKHNAQSDNLLDYIPVPCVAWERHEDGHVVLKTPKSRHRFMLRLIEKLGRSPFYSVHLDDFGSYVWEQCDGNRCLEDIGYALQSHFGKNIEPVFERLGTFVKILSYQKYITYKGLCEKTSKS